MQTGLIEEPSVEHCIPSWGFFGHNLDPLNQQPLCLQANRHWKAGGWGPERDGEFSVLWKSCWQAPASSRPSDSEQGRPTQQNQLLQFYWQNTHSQEQLGVLPDMPALLCCHSLSQVQGEEELMTCFLSILWAGIMRHYKRKGENTEVTTVKLPKGRGQAAQAAYSVAKMVTEFERVPSLL